MEIDHVPFSNEVDKLFAELDIGTFISTYQQGDDMSGSIHFSVRIYLMEQCGPMVPHNCLYVDTCILYKSDSLKQKPGVDYVKPYVKL